MVARLSSFRVLARTQSPTAGKSARPVTSWRNFPLTSAMNSPCEESRRNISRFSSATRATTTSESAGTFANCDAKKSDHPKSCNECNAILLCRSQGLQVQTVKPVLERAQGTGRGAPAISSGRKQPVTQAEFEIKITVEILAQEKGMETHSSRKGINGSHRRLLKGILWRSNSAPTD